ncbi:MAG: 50S ribosomal protein L6 [Candidatus ainarchaeum sp.]|nr:50S ribosomal protein L6 [Candidatus ainarchaeum sp.]MDD3975762.1 50S ribosomal protein L6 [Candidatus ainarchaeum sp.]
MTEEKKIKEIKKNIIDVSKDISIKIEKNIIILEKAGVSQEIVFNPVYIYIDVLDNQIIITPRNKKRKFVSVSNTIKKIIMNAINGFDKEYVYTLSIVYSHFPITVKVDGTNIIISNFLGEKKPRKTKIAPGCVVQVNGKEIIVKGKNKYAVGQTAGSLESTARVIGRDYRVFDDGIYITGKNI